jgi:hypothetical protein
VLFKAVDIINVEELTRKNQLGKNREHIGREIRNRRKPEGRETQKNQKRHRGKSTFLQSKLWLC